MPLKDRLNLPAPPVFLVDGSAFIYRGFYAFRDMNTRDGRPSNALYMVLRMMLKILREERPAHLGFFLDGKGPTFRNELYPAYKAQRQATPEDLLSQIEPVKEALALLGVRVLVSEGCEADDCIAALAARLKRERPVVIVGSDKDLRQCLDEGVTIWDPGAKQERLETVADFVRDTGLAPSSWPDFQALIGDSSDNIPGVPGIGPKSAAEIMAGAATLEEVFARLPDLPEKYRKKLDGQEEAARTWRELTRLRTDVCQDLALDGLRLAEPDLEGLRAFVQRWEFSSLLRELPQAVARAASPSAAPVSAKAAPGQGSGQGTLLGGAPESAPAAGKKPALGPSLFDFMAPAAAEAPAPDVRRAAHALDLPDLTGRAVGLAPVAEGQGLRLGVDGEEWAYDGDEAALAQALGACAALAVPSLKELLARHAAWAGFPLAKVRDVSLMAYLLSPEEREYGLDHLRLSLAQDPGLPPLSGEAPGLAALALGELLAQRLDASGMAQLYADLELPLIPVLRAMEAEGVALDLSALAAFLDEVMVRIDALTARIHAAAGGEFNVRSSQQLGQTLFEKLGLKPRGKTPGGQSSTSQAVLEKMAGDHEIIDLVLEFRGLEKMRSTYLEPLPRLVDEKGRIHTTFNNLSTATGRLSSSGPNLQNIPIRGEMGGRMRACFKAAPGHLLASADYSQIELRVLAHLCGDPGLTGAFRAGEDIHARTAALLQDKEPGEVSPDERRAAKTINFGLLYGMGPQRLSRELKIPLAQAKEFIARYFERMPKVKAFFEGVEQEARRDGFVTTLLGRRRLLPGLRSRNDNEQSQAVRQAINTRVQGSAADVIKLAMLRAHSDGTLRRLGARLLLQVHDELLIEAPADTARQAGERLASLMSSAIVLDVPLAVDMGVGLTWAEAH